MLIQAHNLSQRELEGALLPSVLGCLIRPRGTLVQSLLTSKWPAHHSAILVFIRPRGMLIQIHRVFRLSAGGLYSLGWASLYRLGGALMRPLLKRVKPLPPSASVVRNDPTNAHSAVI